MAPAITWSAGDPSTVHSPSACGLRVLRRLTLFCLLIRAADVRVEELIFFGESAHGSLIAHSLKVALPVEQVRPFATYSRVSVVAHGCLLAGMVLTYGVETELSAVLNTVRCAGCESLQIH